MDFLKTLESQLNNDHLVLKVKKEKAQSNRKGVGRKRTMAIRKLSSEKSNALVVSD